MRANLLGNKTVENIDFATIDYDRKDRCGVAEVIYGAGKTKEQILTIAGELLKSGEKTVLVTRMDETKAAFVIAGLAKDGVDVDYDAISMTCVIGEYPKADGIGKVAVGTAGTSDQKVAKEASMTLKALGNEVVEINDVGVAGINRLLARVEEIREATVVIAIAGMEGALASVVGGLVKAPVIAVPTSVGYGANFEGLSALLSMINSCASGVSVVNIDNGFGAAYQASLINHILNK